MKFQATLRMIWGLAKSPELSMSGEELHMRMSLSISASRIRFIWSWAGRGLAEAQK